MAAPKFVPGQRWISNTEADLGLGIVVEFANRRVEIAFPACAETRTYAADTAPLSRVVYEPEEVVQDNDDQQLVILERMEHHGCYIYRCTTEEGDERIVPELELNSSVHFSRPEQRLFAGQIDRHSQFKLRVRTLEHQHRLQSSEGYGLLGARVQLLPHQLHIASELSNRAHPRALLADEVGLGKTIEAGLVVHQRIIRGRASRVLIVVPDNLVNQWLVELLRRFNLRFTVLNEERCMALIDSGEENPFESSQLVLAGLSLLTRSELRMQQALEAGWDLMVVDEAHHLGWSPEAPSHGYSCIEALANEVPGVLLLTATPEQLGPEGHFARLRLLDPQRYHDLGKFVTESAEYHALSEALAPLLEESGVTLLRTDSATQALVTEWLGDKALQQWLALDEADQPEALDLLIKDIIDRQGTGRVLFRNTRDTVSGFPERQLKAAPLEMPESFDDVNAALEQQLCPELLLGSAWVDEDPRVAWLVEWLKAHRKEKVLVICANAQTTIALEDYLNLREGVRTAAFHEGMSLLNRDRAAAYFADQDMGAQVLICSEIGSEGRNFQFASHLVLFDLPLSPDLLEQRIGRLDRIGQQNDVQIHVPFYESSATEVLLRWYDEGLGSFSHVCAVGEALYHQFADQLSACLMEPTDFAAIDALVEETKAARIELEAKMSAGRDRLLELSSCNPVQANKLAHTLEELEQQSELQAYAEKLFDRFGVDTQPHGPDGLVLQMGEHMFCQLPGLEDEGLTLTFNRDTALSREDIEFMSWEHPLLAGTMELVLNSEFGNNSLVTLKLPPLPAGTLLLEAIYQPRSTAPKGMQLARYLSKSLVRTLISPDGKDLSAVLAHEPLNKLAETVPRNASQNMVRLARDQIVAQLKKSDAIAKKARPELVSSAIAKMEEELDAEYARLESLAQVNPLIHPQELEVVAEEKAMLRDALERTDLVLDAIRVILVRD